MSFELGLDHARMLVNLIENGPIKSTELLPVSIRNTLLEQNLASRVIVDGEDNFVAATVDGKNVYCKKLIGVDSLPAAIRKRQANGELTRFAR